MGPIGTPEGNGINAAPADWTIMLYIAADDTLANFAVESLKQLNKSASAPAEKTDASVLVAAHFAFPADTSKSQSTNVAVPGEYTVHDYIFKELKGDPPDPAQVRTLPDPVTTSTRARTADGTNPPDQETLKQFLDWACSACKAHHYALVLWGHGPELLLQPIDSSNGARNSLYLTPLELRAALKEWEDRNQTHLDIIAFDACSMSMFEMGYELSGLATYMVASQDDVPDLSFPYGNLIQLFRKCGKEDNLDSLLTKGVDGYVNTYEDCICNNATGMKEVTLSALNLNNGDALKNAVDLLAGELSKAKDEPGLANLLVKARASSQDYAGGLYVDFYDFSTKLTGQLDTTNQKYKAEIQAACQAVRDALNQGTSNFILKNSPDDRGHGVSIYLPYLTEGQYTQVSKPLVKGEMGTRGVKGYGDILNGAATEYLMCARRNLILDTENYYGRLKLARETQWYSFIADQWTRVLMETAPAELDYHYSAQQSWMNITRPKSGNEAPRPGEDVSFLDNDICVMK